MKSANNLAFIIGTGRCGTSILAKILNAHSKICVPHELQILFEYNGNGPRFYEWFSSNEHLSWNADDFIKKIQGICTHDFQKFFDYESFFRKQKYPLGDLRRILRDLYGAIAASRKKKIFLEQTPWYGQRLDVMIDLFPDAKFIHMIRDGRDVALSFSRTFWWHKSPLENLDRWQREIIKITGDAASLLSRKKYLEVRYEDFVRDPEKSLRGITDFLGVPFEKKMLLPENLIDYSAFGKTDIRTISSAAYNAWDSKKDRAVFDESVYAWKREPAGTFSDISCDAKIALSKFGYTV